MSITILKTSLFSTYRNSVTLEHERLHIHQNRHTHMHTHRYACIEIFFPQASKIERCCQMFLDLRTPDHCLFQTPPLCLPLNFSLLSASKACCWCAENTCDHFGTISIFWIFSQCHKCSILSPSPFHFCSFISTFPPSQLVVC